ncbi:hemolysin activation/secretion protein [Pseudoduganella flava]|uniref:Hemolysin activation/secretion protein n=2 Tax=Pseudoduganella flava TaxID=871742 RepID=A0A562PVP8_9BURK|nr:ShlB/FhaC/HecB family hemolysin secretion/activation protein [Pseudoduganella flava]TWI48453.1 hemolysin activation/secretion protein [Pseudoduganella flava]
MVSTFLPSRLAPPLAFAMLGSALFSPACAQVAPGVADQQLQRQQQREEARRKLEADAQPDVRLQAPPSAPGTYPEREAPCFVIRDVTLDGDAADGFRWALDAARPGLGRCLGSTGINVMVGAIQNALIAKGYVTTRVLAAAQDLQGGTLRLTLVPGRIRAIRFAEPGQDGHYASALPARPGELLNLRAIEQGLENFKRVPGADADIQVVPGEQPGDSDLVIKWQGGRAWRLSMSLDDSGSHSTGTYQGGATLSVDNPTGLHDLFYVTLNHHVPGDSPGGNYGTGGSALHYSVPYGWWLLTLQFNDYRYHQTVAGANQDYLYSGTSTNTEVKLARLVYRDAVRKTTLSVRAWQRRSRNFIDDTEVEVQRRRMGGFTFGVAHKEFIGSATVDASLAWKMGTSAFGTLPAPEEPYGEGTSRPRVLSGDVNANWPLTQALTYQLAWRGQWNRTPLVPQDRFSIGGRYTVRGYDGEASLIAERGWLLRNDLVWTVPGTQQQLYAALDHGVVAGPSAPALLGTRLTGAAVGWRGQLKGLQVDVFAGKPVHKPAAFRTAAVATGFTLNYEY